MAPSCQSHAEAGAVSADAPTAGINDGFRPTAALGEPTAIEPERTVGSRGTGRVEQPGRGGSWVALPGAAVGPPPALSAWQPDSVSRRASVSALLDLAKGSRRPSRGSIFPGLATPPNSEPFYINTPFALDTTRSLVNPDFRS